MTRLGGRNGHKRIGGSVRRMASELGCGRKESWLAIQTNGDTVEKTGTKTINGEVAGKQRTHDFSASTPSGLGSGKRVNSTDQHNMSKTNETGSWTRIGVTIGDLGIRLPQSKTSSMRGLRRVGERTASTRKEMRSGARKNSASTLIGAKTGGRSTTMQVLTMNGKLGRSSERSELS